MNENDFKFTYENNEDFVAFPCMPTIFQQLFKMWKKDPFKIVLDYLILIFDSKGTVYSKFESKVFIKGLGGFGGKSLM